jgi:hypothetical protein
LPYGTTFGSLLGANKPSPQSLLAIDRGPEGEGEIVSDLLDRMRRNPQGDWTINDVERVCREHGLTCLPPKRGSHYKIIRPGFAPILTIPFKRPIKPVYIRRLVYVIDYRKDGDK